MMHKDTYEEAINFGLDGDLAFKYVDYVRRKERAMKFGRTNAGNSDSSRKGVYESEFAAQNKFVAQGGNIEIFESESAAKRRMVQITKSKLWTKLTDGMSNRTHEDMVLGFMRDQGSRARTAGYSTGKVIKLAPAGMQEYTLIHELAHSSGNMHHDLGFRADLLQLVSRFISPNLANCLKKEFKARKLKVTAPKTVKSVEEWYESYLKMQSVRRCARRV